MKTDRHEDRQTDKVIYRGAPLLKMSEVTTNCRSKHTIQHTHTHTLCIAK